MGSVSFSQKEYTLVWEKGCNVTPKIYLFNEKNQKSVLNLTVPSQHVLRSLYDFQKFDLLKWHINKIYILNHSWRSMT